jgi:uncharacterized protein YecE (DUF72 family)
VGALDSWLGRIGETYHRGEAVFVYFNNDHGAAAVHDGFAFARRAGQRGFRVTRTGTAHASAAAA